VWADDLHHQVRRMLAGDSDGYYRDFSGTAADIAATIRQGWFFTGQRSEYLGEARGTDPAGIPRERFVVCLQNHDQIGNRAFGERLHHQIDLASFRAALVLLLTAPETPLLFMGQEWAASAPFLYFTDHHAELGRLVTDGRRREFGRFAAFADPAARARIPDPQDERTFRESRLDWRECDQEPHAGMRRLHASLLRLRRERSAFARSASAACDAYAPDGDTVVIVRRTPLETIYAVVRLRGSGSVSLSVAEGDGPAAAAPWQTLLTSEDPSYTNDGMRPVVDVSGGAPTIRFARPSAVVLKSGRGDQSAHG
jgi:maltooligosyltrehalose trehalohydrolase